MTRQCGLVGSIAMIMLAVVTPDVYGCYLHAKFDIKDPRACRVQDFAVHDAGRFVVGVGLTAVVNQSVMYARTLYPAVEASAGSAADLGTLTLPVPLRKYELQGTAVDAGGAPVAGASIVVVGARLQQLTMDVKTRADGTFTVNVFEGQSIRVRGFINVSTNPFRQPNAEQALTVSGPPEPIRLVLVVH